MLFQDIPFSMILYELLLCWERWAARRWLPWSGCSVLSCAVVYLCTQSLLLSFSLDRSCELDSIWHCMESHKYSYRFMFGQLFLAFKKCFSSTYFTWPTELAENAHRKHSSEELLQTLAWSSCARLQKIGLSFRSVSLQFKWWWCIRWLVCIIKLMA